MRTLLTSFLFLLITVTGESQDKSIIIDSARLYARADSMLQSFMAKDYKTFIRFTYPKVVTMIGGEKSMIDVLKKSVDQMNDEGFAFDSCVIGQVQQVVRAGKEIHALVPQKIILKSEKGLLAVDSYLLAISKDGVKWYFLDAGNFSEEKIKLILPDFNSALKIPEKSTPVFTEY